MKNKLSRMKSLFVALVCGGMPLVTYVSCDPYYGSFDLYRNDDSGDYYYDDGYYGGGYYYDDYYCDPYYCY